MTSWLLVLATIVVVQAVSVSGASASCGDYLIHGESGHRMAQPNDRDPEPLSLPVPVTPCRGPGCQKAPADPIVPGPTRLAPLEVERLGCLTDSLPVPTQSPTSFDIEMTEQPMSGFLLLIEHPPRATR